MQKQMAHSLGQELLQDLASPWQDSKALIISVAAAQAGKQTPASAKVQPYLILPPFPFFVWQILTF